jgi:sulfur carrier protein
MRRQGEAARTRLYDVRMVTVDVAGGDTHEVEGETYADLLEAVELSPQEATALVDDRPVPDDATVGAEYVEVVQLVKGG